MAFARPMRQSVSDGSHVGSLEWVLFGNEQTPESRPGEPVVTAPRPAATTPSQGLAATLRRRWLLVVVVVIALALLVGGWMGFSYLFLRPAAPAAVGLTDASPTASAATAETAAPAASADPSEAAASSANTGASAGLDGTWTTDPSVGSFSDFSSSFVGYRVEEELANIGAATAVGRTPDVTGSLTFDGSTVTAAEFTADLTTLQSDKSQRDGQLRRQALETNTYATATFTLTQPIDLGAVPVDGQVVQATATGDLTLHGTTKSVQIPLEARLSGAVVTVTGSIDVVFADYGIARPNSFMVLSIADHGTMEVQLRLTKGLG
jgi:polyisoprenoid-binding protein YceI